jgi:hypothetical protein
LLHFCTAPIAGAVQKLAADSKINCLKQQQLTVSAVYGKPLCAADF